MTQDWKNQLLELIREMSPAGSHEGYVSGQSPRQYGGSAWNKPGKRGYSQRQREMLEQHTGRREVQAWPVILERLQQSGLFDASTSPEPDIIINVALAAAERVAKAIHSWKMQEELLLCLGWLIINLRRIVGDARRKNVKSKENKPVFDPATFMLTEMTSLQGEFGQILARRPQAQEVRLLFEVVMAAVMKAPPEYFGPGLKASLLFWETFHRAMLVQPSPIPSSQKLPGML